MKNIITWNNLILILALLLCVTSCPPEVINPEPGAPPIVIDNATPTHMPSQTNTPVIPITFSLTPTLPVFGEPDFVWIRDNEVWTPWDGDHLNERFQGVPVPKPDPVTPDPGTGTGTTTTVSSFDNARLKALMQAVALSHEGTWTMETLLNNAELMYQFLIKSA